MPRNRSPLARIAVLAVAITAALACATEHDEIATRASSSPSAVTLRLDYAGAAALIDALERDSLSAAEVDSLLRVHGLSAMIENVPRFVPQVGVTEFRQEIREFARTKKGGKYDPYFDLSGVWQQRSAIRALISAIRADENRIASETISRLAPYRPDTGSLAVSAWFVAGGVSTGFAFENEPTSLYANLARAGGDVNGLVLNITHEAYHVMQFRAQRQAGLDPVALASAATPPVDRLFATTLTEGTANYVVDPTRWTAPGAAMDSARQHYARNAAPTRSAENFSRFDTVLLALSGGRMTWDKAYFEGFTSANDESFYFVGYEMTKAIERYCGRECIARLFRQPPVEFFRQYVALYHQHADIRGRFSAASEALIAAGGAKAAS